MDDYEYFGQKCSVCGWIGSSQECAGGDQIADTGDYTDLICPDCFKKHNYNPTIEARESELCDLIVKLRSTQSPSDMELAPKGTRDVLEAAFEGMCDMIGYVDKYFVQKHGHQDYIDKVSQILSRYPQQAQPEKEGE